MIQRTSLAAACWLLGLQLLAGLALAQEPQLRNHQPAFYVRAQLNHETGSYREGDALQVTAAAEVNAYLYVFYHQADGKSFLIFPNKQQPNNRVPAKQAVQIPGDDDLFRWQIGAPFGKERVTVVASVEPLESLTLQEITKQRFSPVSKEQLKGVELEVGKEEPAKWGADEVELNTFAKNQEFVTEKSRRIGVFFGVSQYMFHTQAEVADKENHRGLNLPACHRDAREFAALLKEVGLLAESKVYTNEEATRKNMEVAITQWLPQRSRPGDTVFIYFSGHGMPILDDNGDEKDDGKDEVLVPHDIVSLEILDQLEEPYKAGKLNPAEATAVAYAKALSKQAGSRDKARQVLLRETGVSDDLFGVWIQGLAGRQIVVILDACYSGGFATDEKDLFAKEKLRVFDFADQEFGRLKDLGQKDLALYSASSAFTTAEVRQEADLSVMTYFLLDAIRNAPAQITLPQAHVVCKAGMKNYFSLHSRLTPHEPFLFNYSSKPVWLKP